MSPGRRKMRATNAADSEGTNSTNSSSHHSRSGSRSSAEESTMGGGEGSSDVLSSPSVAVETTWLVSVGGEGGSGALDAAAMGAPGSTHSDAAINASEGGDVPHTSSDVTHEERHDTAARADAAVTITTRPPWSVTLATPTTRAADAPAADLAAPQAHLHGLGLRHAFERIQVLARTGRHGAALLCDVAALHDDLAAALLADGGDRRREVGPAATLARAAPGTPLAACAVAVVTRVTAFAHDAQRRGAALRTDVARAYQEDAAARLEAGARVHAGYVAARQRCAGARRRALRERRRYREGRRDVDGALAGLRKAWQREAGRRRSAAALCDGGQDDAQYAGAGAEEESADTSCAPDPQACWKAALRQFGARRSLAAKCEAVIKAAEAAEETQAKYLKGVAEENLAVDEVQAVERDGLDSVQRLEEERIVFLIGLVDRFLQDEKESLESMSLDLAPVEPLDLADGKIQIELPVSTVASTSTASSLFMSPRRRAPSDDGPAINETRMLGLSDNIAGMRDSMKSLGRHLSKRLKTLKLVAAFNEGMASAIESFAASVKSQLESNQSTTILHKNEGANVLSSWNNVMGSLEMYAKHAEMLAKAIRRGNVTLQQHLQSAETKSFQEKEEYRWKSLCDAARVESKARLKHKTCVADLEKSRARMALVESEQQAGGSDGSGVGDGNGSNNDGNDTSPMKQRPQSTKMDRHMNKAMGKMFSIFPGAGEDVMNKILAPQQRSAITKRQFDEAQERSVKQGESAEVARSVKQMAVVSYETEVEAAEFKFKSDERNEWNEMQQSLVCTVEALRIFREEHLKSVEASLDAVLLWVRDQHLGGKALEDVTQWTMLIERRVKDQRDQNAVDAKEEENPFEGFSLQVQLVEHEDIQDVIRRFLDDEDVIVDDAVDNGGEDATTELWPSPKKVNHGDVVVNEIRATPLPDVPPDHLIKKMDLIFAKELKNVSIEKYYSVGWLEETPLYGPWLEKKGSFEVFVGDWEHSSDGDGKGFENPWSRENFPLKRMIRFKFKRTTHLYIGPSVAGVTQTQYLMKDGNDRCIVMMTVEMDGIPYADTFAVEVRWSARRVEDNDIAVEAGVFVRITKSSMFSSKIKSGTLKETSPIHLDLFEVIKSAIESGEEGGGIGNIESEPEREINSPAKVKVSEADTSMDEPLLQVEGKVDQLVAALSSLTQNQQLLLAFVVVCLVTKIFFFRKKDPTADTIIDLSQKVDDLTKEIREMKVMLESILKMSDSSMTKGINQNDSPDPATDQEQ